MPSTTRKEQNGRTLLEIALSLHMAHTGAANRNDGQTEGPTDAENLALLKRAVKEWEPGDGESKDSLFEQSVYWLLRAAISEWEPEYRP